MSGFAKAVLSFTLSGALFLLIVAAIQLRERMSSRRTWRDLRLLLLEARRSPRSGAGRLALSTWLVNGAVHRLPEALSDAERKRWAEEMRADVASVRGRLKRLRCAFRIWRKGAPEMPVGSPETPRSAD